MHPSPSPNLNTSDSEIMIEHAISLLLHTAYERTYSLEFSWYYLQLYVYRCTRNTLNGTYDQ